MALEFNLKHLHSNIFGEQYCQSLMCSMCVFQMFMLQFFRWQLDTMRLWDWDRAVTQHPGRSPTYCTIQGHNYWSRGFSRRSARAGAMPTARTASSTAALATAASGTAAAAAATAADVTAAAATWKPSRVELADVKPSTHDQKSLFAQILGGLLHTDPNIAKIEGIIFAHVYKA